MIVNRPVHLVTEGQDSGQAQQGESDIDFIGKLQAEAAGATLG
jgi:hypothetical protein